MRKRSILALFVVAAIAAAIGVVACSSDDRSDDRSDDDGGSNDFCARGASTPAECTEDPDGGPGTGCPAGQRCIAAFVKACGIVVRSCHAIPVILQVGEACDAQVYAGGDDRQCARGLLCVCPGTCAEAGVPEGGACHSRYECAEGLSCGQYNGPETAGLSCAARPGAVCE